LHEKGTGLARTGTKAPSVVVCLLCFKPQISQPCQ